MKVTALNSRIESVDILRGIAVLGILVLNIYAFGYGLDGIGRWLANTGKMAFTNYLMQSIICMFVFSGFGLGMFGKLSLSELMVVVLAIWAFEIVASQVWLRFFVMVPFAWAWRSLMYYWKRPSLKRIREA